MGFTDFDQDKNLENRLLARYVNISLISKVYLTTQKNSPWALYSVVRNYQQFVNFDYLGVTKL